MDLPVGVPALAMIIGANVSRSIRLGEHPNDSPRCFAGCHGASFLFSGRVDIGPELGAGSTAVKQVHHEYRTKLFTPDEVNLPYEFGQ